MSGEPSHEGAVGPGTELDGFVIEAVAGRGGMGVVYRARQRQPDRLVALKVIAVDLADAPAFRARFQRESAIAAQIEHPNVIPVYAVGEAAGVLYIAMRFVDGIDLRTLLADAGRLAPERAASIVDQVGQALDAAHAHGLVHRDVKPANILISTAGGRDHVYLSDFGISRHIDGSQALTGTGAFVGTIDYVAPEQARGERVDARTDVYSLGCVLFHAVTGTVPFPLENDLAKLYAHDTQPPPSALARTASLPSAFEHVLARAMAKAPDDRYLSAGDLGRAALAAASDASLSRAERSVAVGVAAPPATTAVPGRATDTAPAPTIATPRGHSRRWPIGGAAALAAAAAAFLLISGGSKKHAPTPTPTPTSTTPATTPTTPAPTTEAVATKWLAAFNRGDDALATRYTRPGVVVNVTTNYRTLATPAIIHQYLSRRLCALHPVIAPGQPGGFVVHGEAAYLTATVSQGSRRAPGVAPCGSTGTLVVTLVVRDGKVAQLLSGPLLTHPPTAGNPPVSVAPYTGPVTSTG